MKIVKEYSHIDSPGGWKNFYYKIEIKSNCELYGELHLSCENTDTIVLKPIDDYFRWDANETEDLIIILRDAKEKCAELIKKQCDYSNLRNKVNIFE